MKYSAFHLWVKDVIAVGAKSNSDGDHQGESPRTLLDVKANEQFPHPAAMVVGRAAARWRGGTRMRLFVIKQTPAFFKEH